MKRTKSSDIMMDKSDELPDMDAFERAIFRKCDPLGQLLAVAAKLLPARQVGLMYGTDRSHRLFTPPEKWDRGVVHKVYAKGAKGLIWRAMGCMIIRHKKLSPVRLYRENHFGETLATGGVISFVLRKHQDFYKSGIKILLIDNLVSGSECDSSPGSSNVSILSYDGDDFNPLPELAVNRNIVRQFRAKNFLSAYIPDYGAIIFNTVDDRLLKKAGDRFAHEPDLKQRLNLLISSVEMASLAYLGRARGRQAAKLIWRKEKHLRKTAQELENIGNELKVQKNYLRSVGAVNERQLNTPAVAVADGVYGFVDMVGSEMLRKKLEPRDYFHILNLCHQIAADNANRYFCRVDNYIGDSVFFVNAAPFDDETVHLSIGLQERIMLMVMVLSSFHNEIHLLNQGRHPGDRPGRVRAVIKELNTRIVFRAGMETGPAMIGPLGSRQRKIVTAIGKAVNRASRLESSGLGSCIHISGELLTILKSATITREAGRIRQALAGAGVLHSGNLRGACFLDCYKAIFKIRGDVLTVRENAAYKEFFNEISYIVRCIPDDCRPSV